MAIDLKNSLLLKTLEPLRPYLMGAAGFSFFINILMITPAIYMLQVYDRAVGSQSTSTLLMLTLIMVFLLVSMGGLDWVRGQIMPGPVLGSMKYSRSASLMAPFGSH